MNDNALEYENKSLLQRLNWQDWLYALVIFAGAIFAFSKYSQYMDIYEIVFLFGAAALASYLGWQWKALAKLVLAIGVISIFSITLYDGQQASATQKFLLKFLISSQSAVMWMNVLFVLAMVTYWFALFKRSDLCFDLERSILRLCRAHGALV
jgi:hypothetical protein